MKIKSIAKIIAALACLCILAAILYFFTSSASVSYDVSSVPAARLPDLYAEVCRDHPQYRADEIARYRFVTLSVRVHSRSPFAAEWLCLTPAKEMTVVSGNYGPVDLENAGDTTLTLTYLSDSADYTGGAMVEYYVLGRYHYEALR